MKQCVKCGQEMDDNLFVCPQCNFNSNTGVYAKKVDHSQSVDQTNEIQLAAKIFMILATVISGFCLIPLCWTIPMTVFYCNKVKNGEKVSFGFKICTIIFVNAISGILMLVDDSEVK